MTFFFKWRRTPVFPWLLVNKLRFPPIFSWPLYFSLISLISRHVATLINQCINQSIDQSINQSNLFSSFFPPFSSPLLSSKSNFFLIFFLLPFHETCAPLPSPTTRGWELPPESLRAAIPHPPKKRRKKEKRSLGRHAPDTSVNFEVPPLLLEL